MNDYKIRPAITDDFKFVTSSWVQSYRKHPDIEYNTYNAYQNQLVRNILDRAITIVATDNEDSNQILAWICVEPISDSLCFHWGYTKAIYRNLGIQKNLIAKLNKPLIYFTHRPSNDAWLMKRMKDQGIEHCPYLAFNEMRIHGREKV